MLSCDLWRCPTCRGNGEVNIKDPYSEEGRALCPSCEGTRKAPAPRCDECGLMPSACACEPQCDAMVDPYSNDSPSCSALATRAYLDAGRVWLKCTEHAPRTVGRYELVAGRTLGLLRAESCARAEVKK